MTVNSVTSVLFMAWNKAAVEWKRSAVRAPLHLEFPSFPYQMFYQNAQKAGNQLVYLQIPTERKCSTVSSAFPNITKRIFIKAKIIFF